MHWTDAFPKDRVRDVKSKSRGALMHSKIIILSANECAGQNFQIVGLNEEVDGYMYMGSHNGTKSAWGYKSGKAGDLKISNYELGI
ncbi:hypothetical protein HDV01_004738, partial [Terramyces sp. JEL0728]